MRWSAILNLLLIYAFEEIMHIFEEIMHIFKEIFLACFEEQIIVDEGKKVVKRFKEDTLYLGCCMNMPCNQMDLFWNKFTDSATVGWFVYNITLIAIILTL